jgi:hypothetical protein
MEERTLTPSVQKRLRNEKIFLEIACGIDREEICKKYGISKRHLNRLLEDADREAQQWFQSLPRQALIQIFKFNSQKIFQEIQVLVEIRNKVEDPGKQFEMTKAIINALSQHTKLIADGPALIRQKEVIEAAEKLQESNLS